MPSEPKRKLAAIMFTDMVGYTALMQKDEQRARELIENQRGLLTPLVKSIMERCSSMSETAPSVPSTAPKK